MDADDEPAHGGRCHPDRRQAGRRAAAAASARCLLYTSDDADDLLCVDLGGRRLI